MQYSWLPDTRRALHWRKTALSSVMSFHPSYLTHTACFRLPDKPDICLSFSINAGVRWEKSRWHVQSRERGCPIDNNMRAMPHGDSPSFQWGSAARLCLPTSELSSAHPTPLFLLLIRHMWRRLCAGGAKKCALMGAFSAQGNQDVD